MSNQTPAHAGHNAFLNDGVLVQMTSAMPEAVVNGFARHGRWVASAEAQDLARLANEHTPKLRTHDPRGERLDQVEFHPAYHELMRTAIEHGLPSLPWTDPRAGARDPGNGARTRL